MEQKKDKPEYLLGTVLAIVFACIFAAGFLLTESDIDRLWSLIR